MMKYIIAVVSFLLCIISNASEVEWGTITVYKNYTGKYETSWMPLTLVGVGDENSKIVTGSTYDNMMYGSLWVEAYAGDIITGRGVYEDELTYFAYASHTSDGSPLVFSDYSILVSKGVSTYLGVVLDMGHEGREFWTGWVELTLDANGDIIALSSAFDRSGGPLVVGAIP